MPQPVPLPIHLSDTADHTIRELAFAAQRYGKAAQRDPEDFEAVYNHGLALQELALRSGNSRNEQQKLLTQVQVPPSMDISGMQDLPRLGPSPGVQVCRQYERTRTTAENSQQFLWWSAI